MIPVDQSVSNALDKLTENESCVLNLRFSYKNGKRLSYVKIGRQLGLSGTRARQIEQEALKKLNFSARQRQEGVEEIIEERIER